jgi:hypothetical protein
LNLPALLESIFYRKLSVRSFLTLLILTPFFAGCGEIAEENLPYSMGGIDEILFVVDERLESDTIMTIVEDLVLEDFGYLNQGESRLDPLYTDLEGFQKAFEKHRNTVFIGYLDQANAYNAFTEQLIGEEAADQVQAGEGLFRIERENVWARGQRIHLLLAPDYNTLREGISKGAAQVLDRVQATEFRKIQTNLFRAGENNALEEELAEKFGIKMRLPATFKKHPASNGNFMFIRSTTIDLHNTLFIYEVPYTDTSLVGFRWPIQTRDSLGRLYESSRLEGSYMKTEDRLPVGQDAIEFKGNYAVRTRGLWRLVGDFMGGPFISYSILDESANRVILIDGYVYAPDMKKRKLIRELDAIIQTVEILPPVEN